MAMQATRDESATLVDVVDRVLDRGLVINADITVSVADVELLGITIRATLASFETAAQYGLEFPSGTNVHTEAWQRAQVAKEECPGCSKRVPHEELLHVECPWCGWMSVKARRKAAEGGRLRASAN